MEANVRQKYAMVERATLGSGKLKLMKIGFIQNSSSRWFDMYHPYPLTVLRDTGCTLASARGDERQRMSGGI